MARSFLSRPADEVARALLGCRLCRRLDDGTVLSGMIVETEAYLGPEDQAAHSFGGRRTERTEPMFMRPGTSYVYFTYGMHYCMNVSAAAENVPHAVLLRAIEPLEGIERMLEFRSASRGKLVRLQDLCNGPAKLCQAMSIDRGLNRVDLCSSDVLWLERGKKVSDLEVGQTPRIGIANAGTWADRPLRWVVRESPWISRRFRAQS